MDLEADWNSVRAKIAGLWPRYEPTDAERALIVSRLASLRMRWLDSAVEAYRCESTSTVFRLSELLEHYRRIASTGETMLGGTERQTPAQRRASEEQALQQDEQECRQWLASRTRDEIAAAVKWLRERGWLSREPLPARVDEWRRSTIMLVVGAMRQ